MPRLLISLVILVYLLSPSFSYARTTPEDIVNSKKETYEQRAKSYSSSNKTKLENLSLKIAEVNKKRSQELEQIMLKQGLILDEYIRRNNYIEDGGKDGISRNLQKDVENARYWITYAHEAVAFQAAKIYIFNLTSESNIKGDANNLISNLQSDLNSTRGKVIKSQNILLELVKEN